MLRSYPRRHHDTWLDALEGWTSAMRAAGRAENTIDKRRYHVIRLAEEHLDRSPWRLTYTDLANWLGRQGWAPNTRHSYRSSMRVFYSWAAAAGKIKRSPAQQLEAVDIPRRRPRPVPDDVWQPAINAGLSDRTRLILLTAGYTGLRRSELGRLRWDQIERRSDGSRVFRIAGKGGHERIIPIADPLDDELEAEHSRRRNGTTGTGHRFTRHADTYIFPGMNGPTTGDAIGRTIKRALGGGVWTAHKVRHRFATAVYANTKDLFALQELLGHKSPATTRIYTVVPEASLRAAVNTL